MTFVRLEKAGALEREIWNRKRNHGITESQKRKQKRNTESVKEGSKRSIWKYISNDNKINKQI